MIGSGIQRKAFWNKEFKFLVLERVEDLVEASDVVQSLPFILLLALSMRFQNISFYALDRPFGFSP